MPRADAPLEASGLLDVSVGLAERASAAASGVAPASGLTWRNGGADAPLLAYREFKAASPKGFVVWQHGVGAHCNERSDTLLGEACAARGLSMFAMDLSGHGYSEGLSCYIEDYTQHVDDLEKFVAHVRRQHGLGSLPFFVGGESYGGGLSLLVGLRLHGHPLNGQGFCGVLLAAPLVVGNAPPAPVTWTLRNCCLPCCPTAAPFFMPNPVNPEAIWNDPAIRAEKARDSMRW